MEKRTKIKFSIFMAALMIALFVHTGDAAPPGDTIIDVALAVNAEGAYAGDFDTLIAAILAADASVFETLDGNGQFTVFAPTDDAFGLLGLDPDNVGSAFSEDVLTDILLYHVLRGRRDAIDVLGSSRLNTLLKREFIFQSDGVLTDNLGRTAGFEVTNVMAANGIIHVIDAVVLPYAPE